ncbi:hypothetical protein [Vibrio sp.]|uniref:hypothetical protein n=1 Tax=Vibrio sp. TaxID=678 RepID=UPI00311F3C6E
MIKRTLLLSFFSLGATASPIQIDSCEKLLNLENKTNLDYELVQNIDCAGLLHSNPKIFSGNLNGNGYSVSNLSIIATKGNIGLFSKIDSGEVKNLTINSFQITTQGVKAQTVGALAGLLNGGLIKNVTISNSSIVNAVGAWATGLLVGRADNAMLQNITVEHSILSTTTKSGSVGGVSGWLIDGAGANEIKVHDLNMTIKNNSFNDTGGIFGKVYNTDLSLLEITDSAIKRNDLAKNGHNGLLVGKLDKSTINNGSLVNITHNFLLGKYNGIAAGVINQSEGDELVLNSISHNDEDNTLGWHYIDAKQTYRTNNLYINLDNESTLPPPVCRL